MSADLITTITSFGDVGLTIVILAFFVGYFMKEQKAQHKELVNENKVAREEFLQAIRTSNEQKFELAEKFTSSVNNLSNSIDRSSLVMEDIKKKLNGN